MSKTISVLLVEDDPEDVLLFRRASPKHFKVEHVPSAAAALRSLRGGGFDLCFTDYRLGLDTGLELVREARGLGMRLPIVVITGQDVESLGENALLAGATDFLPKDDLCAAALARVARWAQIRRLVEIRRDGLSLGSTLTQALGRPSVETSTQALSLRRAIYFSTAQRSFTPQQLLGLCASFAAFNARVDITGVLLYVGHRFLQVLEGEAGAVDRLLQRIAGDTRHRDMEIVLDERVETRVFGQWSMGCINADERYELSSSQLLGMRAELSQLLERCGNAHDGMRQLIRTLPDALRHHAAARPQPVDENREASA